MALFGLFGKKKENSMNEPAFDFPSTGTFSSGTEAFGLSSLDKTLAPEKLPQLEELPPQLFGGMPQKPQGIQQTTTFPPTISSQQIPSAFQQASTLQSQTGFSQAQTYNNPQQTDASKDFAIISAKLDLLKNLLEQINERLTRIESDKPKTPKWY